MNVLKPIAVMLTLIYSPIVHAEAGPTSRGCVVWFSNSTSSVSRVELHAVSNASTGLDRLATAVELVRRVSGLTGAQFVEVNLYGEGTVPFKPHLNGNTTTAFASYSVNKDEWVGMYATRPTSDKITAKRGLEGNPWLDIEFMESPEVKGLSYNRGKDLCNLKMTNREGIFIHPNLLSFVPKKSPFRTKIMAAASEFLRKGY